MSEPSSEREREPHPDPAVEALLRFGPVERKCVRRGGLPERQRRQEEQARPAGEAQRAWEEKARAEAEAWQRRAEGDDGPRAESGAGER